jgi:type I site-specific restriction endonuclease
MASTIQIDHDRLNFRTESDVEQKLLMPLLSGEAYLAIPQALIRTKDYLAPTKLDKSAGKNAGYFPDYSVWRYGFAVMIVEAKAPGVPVEEGYREASLYARHLNQNYPTGLNPCRFIISCNGADLQFGYWDSGPVLTTKPSELLPGSSALQDLRRRCGLQTLDEYGRSCLARC